MVITRELAILALRKFPDMAAKMSIEGHALQIYLFALKLDFVTANIIATKFKIPHGLAYRELTKLLDKGYMVKVNNTKHSNGNEFAYSTMFNGDIK